MTIDAITGSTTRLVSAALDAALMRHQVHATNIANASVTGYQPMRVDFGDALARARADILAAPGESIEVAPLVPELVPTRDAFGVRADKVELDVEVAEIAQNTLASQALMKGLSKYLGILGVAVTDGRR